jgi:hypothetical protein
MDSDGIHWWHGWHRSISWRLNRHIFNWHCCNEVNSLPIPSPAGPAGPPWWSGATGCGRKQVEPDFAGPIHWPKPIETIGKPLILTELGFSDATNIQVGEPFQEGDGVAWGREWPSVGGLRFCEPSGWFVGFMVSCTTGWVKTQRVTWLENRSSWLLRMSSPHSDGLVMIHHELNWSCIFFSVKQQSPINLFQIV